MIGLKKNEVKLQPYAPEWSELFAQEKARLDKVLGARALDIQHIGSTAIPDICAKPIIDIAIALARPELLPACTADLQQAGYEHLGEYGLPGREFFTRGQPTAFHVHVVGPKSPHWTRWIGFRDALLADPGLVRDYDRFKRGLARKHPQDREAYTEGKNPFIERVLEGRKQAVASTPAPAALPSAEGRIILTCPKGIPPYLQQEVSALGFPVVAAAEATVETRGTLDDTMRLNLHLRTAHRVLFLLKEFRAASPDELYRAVADIPWENYIQASGYFSVHSAVSTNAVKDPRFATLRCKDAIVDRIRSLSGRRPDSGSEPLGAAVFLHWQDQAASVYLDTSGEPLSRRGYRRNPHKAPMQETLAAATLLATAWNGKDRLINPMCGSGTIAIEAALLGLRRAPGLCRESFAFMHLKTFRRDRWNAMVKEAWRDARSTLAAKIVATDIDPEAIIATRKNAQAAGVEHVLVLDVCDFRKTPLPQGGPGLVFFNPEYGERLGDEASLEPIYAAIGDFLKKSCSGYQGYVFTGNLALSKKIGLKPRRRLVFFNSNIECRLLEYDLYEGTKLDHAAEQEE